MQAMMGNASFYFEIGWIIILLIPIYMMNLLAFLEASSNLLFCHNPMLICVPTHIS